MEGARGGGEVGDPDERGKQRERREKKGRETGGRDKEGGRRRKERGGEIKPQKRKWGKRDVKAERGWGREGEKEGGRKKGDKEEREHASKKSRAGRDRHMCHRTVPQAAQEASGKSKSSPYFVEGSGSKPSRVSEV